MNAVLGLRRCSCARLVPPAIEAVGSCAGRTHLLAMIDDLLDLAARGPLQLRLASVFSTARSKRST
jgi:hypothetical protein